MTHRDTQRHTRTYVYITQVHRGTYEHIGTHTGSYAGTDGVDVDADQLKALPSRPG